VNFALDIRSCFIFVVSYPPVEVDEPVSASGFTVNTVVVAWVSVLARTGNGHNGG
jgi:hypothetical protein